MVLEKNVWIFTTILESSNLNSFRPLLLGIGPERSSGWPMHSRSFCPLNSDPEHLLGIEAVFSKV